MKRPSSEAQLELFSPERRHAGRRIEAYFSDDLERLARRLFASVTGDTMHDRYDPFAPPLVLVPNRNLRRWLQMRLSRQDGGPGARGVCAHVNFQFLEEGFFTILTELDPAKERPRLLTDDHLIFAILGVFADDEVMRAPELAVLHEYLQRGAERPGAAERRGYYLARRLAGLFREYEYHRHSTLSTWLKRPSIDPGPIETEGGTAENVRPMFRAQRELYRRVFGFERDGERQAGLIDRLGVVSLAEYARRVLVDRRKDLQPLPDRTVHVFGISQLSRLHTRMIFELGEFADFRFYLPAAHRAYAGVFESTSPGEDDWTACTSVADPEMIDVDGLGDERLRTDSGARLFDLWGKPAREMFYLLAANARPNDVFYADTRSRAPARTLLHHIQRSLAGNPRRANDGARGTVRQDDSVRIVGCPGRRREIETVFHSILQNMQADPSLRLTDIAVLLPDMERYRGIIEAVFDAGRDEFDRPLLPYNLTDFSAGNESVYTAGLTALLDLCESAFTRKDVFEFAMNDAFLASPAAHGVAREQVLAWVDWADRLNVYRGFDASHQRELEVNDDGLYTWQHALRRLRLGRIMQSNDEAVFEDVEPFEDMHSRDERSLAVLSTVLEDLRFRLRQCTESCAAGKPEALDELRAILHEYLAPPPERPAESRVRDEIFAALADFQNFLSVTGQTLSFALLRAYLLDHGRSISGSRGGYLSGGVTIASLRPMRPVPFRIVYIPGLGESGDFPGRADVSALNLLTAKRRIGDANAPEVHRLLFLENLLLSVKDRLYLLYECRDTRKDREFQPCSPVAEFESVLSEEFLGGAAFRRDFVPLRLSGERYLQRCEENADVMANFSVEDRSVALLNAARRSLLSDAQEKLSDLPASLLRRSFRPAELQATGAMHESVGELVDLRDLKAFLVSPAEALLRRRHGLRPDTEDEGVQRTRKEDEPFYSKFPENIRLPVDALHAALGRNVSVDELPEAVTEIILKRYQREMLRGRMPHGAFAGRDRRLLVNLIRRRSAILQAWHAKHPFDRRCLVVFGEDAAARRFANDSALTMLQRPALQLSLQDETLPLELNGSAGHVAWLDEQGRLAGCLTISGASGVRPEDYLGGFLFAMMLYAAEAAADFAEPAPAFEVQVVAREKSDRIVLTDPGRATARAYLQSLCEDFLFGTFHDVPLAAVLGKTTMRPWATGHGADAETRAQYRREIHELREAEREDRDGLLRLVASMERGGEDLLPRDVYDLVQRRFALPGPLLAPEKAAKSSSKKVSKAGGPA